MRRIFEISALALSCAFVITNSAVAQTPAKASGKVEESTTCHEPQSLTKALSLSDDQLEKLKSVHEKYHLLAQDKMQGLGKLHHEMAEAIDQPDVTKESLLATQAKINAIQADLENNRVEMIVETNNIYTPAQRKILHHLKLEHEVAHEHRFGFGPPPGPPGFGGPPGLGGPPGPGGHCGGHDGPPPGQMF